MNYTPNYQLPQWVESDRVLMTDFNDAMGKVDTAIKGRWGKELLKEVTTSYQRHQWDIDVNGIDFSQYQLIVIEYCLTGNAYCGFLINGTGSSQLAYIGMMETLSDIPGHAILFPLGCESATVRCLGLGYGNGFGAAAVKYSEIHTLTFVGKNENYYMGNGSYVKIYGVG